MITVPFFCFKDKLHLMYFKRYIELSIFILITLFMMFNVVTYSEAIKHYTLRMQMLMTASKDYSLGNVQHCRQKCFFFPYLWRDFQCSSTQRNCIHDSAEFNSKTFSVLSFFICQVAFKLQIYMRKPQCTDF